jgi:hypothetical protein
MDKSGKDGVNVEAYPHEHWPQNSVVAQIKERATAV